MEKSCYILMRYNQLDWGWCENLQVFTNKIAADKACDHEEATQKGLSVEKEWSYCVQEVALVG